MSSPRRLLPPGTASSACALQQERRYLWCGLATVASCMSAITRRRSRPVSSPLLDPCSGLPGCSSACCLHPPARSLASQAASRPGASASSASSRASTERSRRDVSAAASRPAASWASANCGGEAAQDTVEHSVSRQGVQGTRRGNHRQPSPASRRAIAPEPALPQRTC